MHLKQLMMVLLFICSPKVFAEVIDSVDSVQFYQSGVNANFAPGEELTVVVKKGDRKVFSKSLGIPSAAAAYDYAVTNAMIKAALKSGSSIEIEEASQAGLYQARKRIEVKKLSKVDAFTKAYIKELQDALYAAQRAKGCASSPTNKSSSALTGTR